MHAAEAERLRRLLAAHEAGDEAGCEMQLAQWLAEREQSLFANVARLTRELHQTLFESRQEGGLAQFAREELPDACSRLDYVVQLSERAAHQTLDLVDRSRESLQAMTRACTLMEAGAEPANSSVLEARRHLHSGIESLRGHLTELAQIQEYQDIGGQLVRRVIELVRGVESALLHLLRGASAPMPTSRAEAPRLQGPAVPGLSASALNQQDADQLLSSLGF